MIGNGGENDDEGSGYGRPPRYTRFPKGRSGNPRGRPRKQRPEADLPADCPISRIILMVGNQKLPGKVAGRTREMTYIEALLQKQVRLAIGGNHNAQRDFLHALRLAEKEQAAYLARKHEEQQREFDLAVQWRQDLMKIWAQAERRGGEPDDPWPHPDDVLLDHGKLTWRIRGPAYERDVPFYEMLQAERDLQIMEEVLAWCGTGKAEQRGKQAYFHRLLWLIYDQILPNRWQIPPGKAEFTIDRLVLMPIKAIRRMHRECEMQASLLRRHDRPASKDTYATVNLLLKPALKALGYRSWAHFVSVHGGEAWR